MPVDAAGLYKLVRSSGESVNPATLRKILNGATKLPHASTLEKVLRAVGATHPQRDQVLSARFVEMVGRKQSTITLLDAFGGKEVVDRGRGLERVLWSYMIGVTDDDDIVRETRRTAVGPEGLILASLGPGQLGQAAFPILEFPRLGVKVEAHRVVAAANKQPVPAYFHVVDMVPEQRRYRSVVQFSGAEPGDLIEWAVTYRWPGLWRALRETGRDAGRVEANVRRQRRVPVVAVELVARTAAFSELELHPLRHAGKLETEYVNDRTVIRWVCRDYPTVMQFDVTG